MKWTDATSYSQGKERIQHAWRTEPTKGFSITVLDDHLYHPGEWVMHCDPWFHTHPLPRAKTPVEAQQMAIEIVRAKINELYNAIAA